MSRNPDLLRNRFGHRYISPRELAEYASSLGFSAVTEDLLEFLERERLLIPVCRVRFPDEVARRGWLTGVDESCRDPTRQWLAEDLSLSISSWRAVHPETHPTFHPLDLVNAEQLEFVDHDVATQPFQPWASFRVRVGRVQAEDGSEHPVYDDHAVRTFYHYWQVFLLAEVLTIGASVIADLRDREIWRACVSGKLDDIPSARRRLRSELSGLHALREAMPHLAAFDAVAFFLDYSQRWLMEVTKDVPGPTVLTGAPLQEYLALERATAAFAIWWKGVDVEAIVSVIKWQCRQWDHWHRRGPQRFADECRHNIEEAAFLYRVLTGATWREVVNKIGRATSYLRPALDVISPDWLHEQNEAAARSLKRWIAPTMCGWATIGFDLTEADADDMVTWVSGRGLLQFFLLFAQLGDLSEYEAGISLALQAKAAEGFGATIEHILNDIGQTATTYPTCAAWPVSGRLTQKVEFLWHGSPVHPHLERGRQQGLTNTAPGFSVQRQSIATLPGMGQDVEVARALLEMLLIRNQSIHGGLAQFERQELFELIQVLLRGAVLNWKRARQLGWA